VVATVGSLPDLAPPWFETPPGWKLTRGRLACSDRCAQLVEHQLVTCDMCLASKLLPEALAEGWQNLHTSVWICPDDQ
jgi:hypothetical protein